MPELPWDNLRPPLGWLPLALWMGSAAALAVAASLGWAGWRRGRAAQAGTGAVPRGRRLVLLVVRVAALGGVAWVLAGPSIRESEPGTAAAPPVVLLADRSASMAERDVIPARGPSARPMARWEAAQAWLSPAYLQRLGTVARVSTWQFSDQVQPLDISPSAQQPPAGGATLLFAALGQAVQALPPGPPGILALLSDGHDTQRDADPAVVDRLRQTGWRVLAVPIGAAAEHPDLAVQAWADADVLHEGQSTTIHAVVTQRGGSGRTAAVELLEDDRVVQRIEARLTSAPSVSLDFPVRPGLAPGDAATMHAFRVRVEPLPGEVLTENNERWVFVQSQKRRIRVALFEAQPYWDTRCLAAALRDDAQVELAAWSGVTAASTTLVHSGATADQSLPADAAHLTRGQLEAFDVVILGKGVERFFSGERARWLVDYVRERGGNLVLARGQPFDTGSAEGRAAAAELAAVEPVEWGRETAAGLRLSLTPSGRASPLFQFDGAAGADALLAGLPDMLSATLVEREKATAIVLLRQSAASSGGPVAAEGMAALAWQTAGQGRVLAVLTDGLWRWALLPSRLAPYDGVYRNFWARAVRWLAAGGEFLPGQAVALTLDRLSAAPHQTVGVRVATRYLDAQRFRPDLSVRGPEGFEQRLTLARVGEASTRYEASFQPPRPGVYQVELRTPGLEPAQSSSPLAVYDQALEKLDVSARPDILERVARATGGRCLDLDDPDALLREAQELAAARQTRPRFRPAFDQPAILAAIGVLLLGEWFFRRRWGLS